MVKIVLAFLVGMSGAGCWFNEQQANRDPDIVSISRFDSIFSKDIKLATTMADMRDLREVSLGVDDFEIRIWRSYSFPTKEGVFIKRVNDQWSGLHLSLKTDERGEVQTAEVRPLPSPESGWEFFLGRLRENGLLLLPLTAESECDTSGVDGIRYIVEISQNHTYRNYQYPSRDDCRESRQMTEIGELIGLEFHSDSQVCKTGYEWFACAQTKK